MDYGGNEVGRRKGVEEVGLTWTEPVALVWFVLFLVSFVSGRFVTRSALLLN